MINIKKRIKFIVGLLLIVVLSACHDENAQTKQKNTDPVRQMQCLKQQSQCDFDVAGGRIDVLFDVNKIIAEQAFNISVSYVGDNTINAISGYMEGVEMFMGKIPLFLEKNIEPNKAFKLKNKPSTELATTHEPMSVTPPQIFQGEVLVASCSAEEMTWRIWLTLTDDNNEKHTQMFTIVSYRH